MPSRQVSGTPALHSQGWESRPSLDFRDEDSALSIRRWQSYRTPKRLNARCQVLSAAQGVFRDVRGEPDSVLDFVRCTPKKSVLVFPHCTIRWGTRAILRFYRLTHRAIRRRCRTRRAQPYRALATVAIAPINHKAHPER